MSEKTPRENIRDDFDSVGREESEPSSVLVLDEEKYLPELADTDLTEEQKSEMLQALWSIMQAFVDIGFEVNSIHRYFAFMAAETSETGAIQVESGDGQYSEKFEEASELPGEKEGDS